MPCRLGTTARQSRPSSLSLPRSPREGYADFVPPAERIATLTTMAPCGQCSEMYVQLAFVLDRVRELATKNPEWKNKQPFKAVLEKDLRL